MIFRLLNFFRNSLRARVKIVDAFYEICQKALPCSMIVLLLVGCSKHRGIEPPMITTTAPSSDILTEGLSALSTSQLPSNGARIVAKVGTKIITNADVDTRCKMVALLSGKSGDEVFMKRIAQQVLEKLVDECVYELMAAQFKIDITENDVNEFFHNYVQAVGMTDAKFTEYLKRNGVHATFMQTERAQAIEYCIIMGAMSKKLLRVTEAQIQEKIDKIKEDEKKTQYSVLEIVFYPKDGVAPDSAARKTYDELRRMIEQMPPISAFQSLARQLSQANTAQNGGYRGWVTAEDLGLAATDVIRTMDVGAFSEPIKVRAGEYRIFFLNDVKQPGFQPYSETQVELRVVSIPYDPSMSDDKQLVIQRRIGTLMGCKSQSELDGMAADYGYQVQTIVRSRDVLPSDVELNKCSKPVFTGKSLDVMMPLKKTLKSTKLDINKDQVQMALEHQLKTTAAEKIFKNYKNRLLIVIDTRRL